MHRLRETMHTEVWQKQIFMLYLAKSVVNGQPDSPPGQCHSLTSCPFNGHSKHAIGHIAAARLKRGQCRFAAELLHWQEKPQECWAISILQSGEKVFQGGNGQGRWGRVTLGRGRARQRSDQAWEGWVWQQALPSITAQWSCHTG